MSNQPIIDDVVNQEYKYGFVTDIEQDQFPPGLNEDVIRLISEKKNVSFTIFIFDFSYHLIPI